MGERDIVAYLRNYVNYFEPGSLALDLLSSMGEYIVPWQKGGKETKKMG
jgi:hypothetical protein